MSLSQIQVQEFTREISLKISRNSIKETVDIATVAYYIEQEVSVVLSF